MSAPRRRPYASALRDNQAHATRELILDALTELLTDQPADQITTRAIAERAGVSQPTVYRHFPDRQALLEGLSDRITALATTTLGGDVGPSSLDDIGAQVARNLAFTDEHAVVATAEAVLNSDPRRLSRSSRARTAALRRLVAEEFPDLDERDHLHITALLRNMYSVQTWLRLREEFGIAGAEGGPIFAWAIDTLVREIRAGNFPRTEAPEPDS